MSQRTKLLTSLPNISAKKSSALSVSLREGADILSVTPNHITVFAELYTNATWASNF